LGRREMAERLVLSEHTVRHHLERIYHKVGASTGVGATLFAIEHDLLELPVAHARCPRRPLIAQNETCVPRVCTDRPVGILCLAACPALPGSHSAVETGERDIDDVDVDDDQETPRARYAAHRRWYRAPQSSVARVAWGTGIAPVS
jgi:hypothetical protein